MWTDHKLLDQRGVRWNPSLATTLLIAPLLLIAAFAGVLVNEAPVVGVVAALSVTIGILLFRTEAFLLAVIVYSGLVDIPAHFQVTAISLSGFATFAISIWCLLLIAVRPYLSRHVLAAVLPMLLYVLWSVFRGGTSDSLSLTAIQNLAVYSGFVCLIIIASQVIAREPSRLQELGLGLNVATICAVLLFLFSKAPFVRLPALSIGERSFAVFALISVAWLLSDPGLRRNAILACLLIVLIGVSLSRTALIVALALVLLRYFDVRRPGGWARMVIFSGISFYAAERAVRSIKPLRERFFEGDLSLEIGGIAINSMGRVNIWESVWENFLNSPWIGYGPGTASVFTESAFGIDHPHNDYLRILYDFGVAGLIFWVLGFGVLFYRLGTAWLVETPIEPLERRIIGTAFLSMAAIGANMITDNVIIYPFMMFPIGIVVGAALSIISNHRVAQSARYRKEGLGSEETTT